MTISDIWNCLISAGHHALFQQCTCRIHSFTDMPAWQFGNNTQRETISWKGLGWDAQQTHHIPGLLRSYPSQDDRHTTWVSQTWLMFQRCWRYSFFVSFLTTSDTTVHILYIQLCWYQKKMNKTMEIDVSIRYRELFLWASRLYSSLGV